MDRIRCASSRSTSCRTASSSSGTTVSMPAANASCRGRNRLTRPGPRQARPRFLLSLARSPDMDAGLLAQYVMNGLMLGMMYALVAVGFTLFFGVLDVIKFSHGDVLTVGAFAALATYVGLRMLGLNSNWLALVVILVVATLAMAFLGMAIARYLVMPLRSAPALNTLLITLMLGTVLRESVRLFYPQGANPKPFPALLPRASVDFGTFNLRL